jgi:hypothetical protein
MQEMILLNLTGLSQEWASEQEIKEIHGDLGGVRPCRLTLAFINALLVAIYRPGYLLIQGMEYRAGTMAYWVGPDSEYKNLYLK